MKRKYACVVEYDGSNYLGFQRQKKGGDIQTVLEDFLTFYLQKNTLIKAAGRTDKGVHALGQVIAFESPRELDEGKFLFNARKYLPKDIAITSLREVPESFDPRHSCKGKVYEYRFSMGLRDPFNARYRAEMNEGLDLDIFEEALNLFVGRHCFRRFCAKPSDPADYIRDIHRIKVYRKGDEYRVVLEGTGFMRHMVRFLVGSAFYAGYRKIGLDEIKEALENPDGERLPYVAAPEGLYLVSVIY